MSAVRIALGLDQAEEPSWADQFQIRLDPTVEDDVEELALEAREMLDEFESE